MSQASELTSITMVNELVAITDDVSAFTETKACGGKQLIGRCIMTIWPTEQDNKWLSPTTYFNDTSCIKVWCGQFETCPDTDKLHAHIYVEFNGNKRPRFDALRKILQDNVGNGNIKVPQKSSKHQRSCAVNYCTKPDTRVEGTTPYFFEGNKHTVAFDKILYNKRTKKEDVTDQQIAWIESKPMHWTWNQILHEDAVSKRLLATCSWGSKFHTGCHEKNA